MAKNNQLELAIKIAGQVDKSLIAAINSANKNISSLSQSMSKIGAVGLDAMGALATGTVAALAKCTDAAQEFETQMSDVVKYVDGLADADGLISEKLASNGATYEENYAAMSDAILDLSTQIPMTAEELTQLAAAAGQSGKGISDLIQFDSAGNIGGFLKDVAMMGTAMDISAEQAGDWAAKWEHSFNMTHDQVVVLSDQINYLGANNATTAAEIAQVVNDSASLGQIAGMSAESTAALATSMLAMGVDSSKAATSISRMYTNLSLGSSATKDQKEMWKSLGFTAEGVAKSMQTDATGTMIEVFEAIRNMDADKQVAALKTLFGQWAITGAAKLTGNLEQFTDTLAMVNDPSRYTGSMEREFIIKASTSQAIDSMMANAFQAMKIDVGTALLPAKKEISAALIDFMNQLRSMPELGEIAQQLAALFSQGVSGAAQELENALPTVQKFLGYLVDNGPQVLSFLGKLAAAFTAMKFAPGIESLLRGDGGLSFGSKTGGSTHTGSGGIVGMLSGLFKGGQNAASAAAAALPNLTDTAGGILGTARIDARLSGKSLLGTLLGGAGTLFGQTKLGGGLENYFGGITSSLGNFLNTTKISGAARGTVGVTREILSNISKETGLTELVNGSISLARTGAGRVAGGVTALASNIVNSAPVQTIGGLAGRAANSAPVQGMASMASGAAGWIANAIPAGAGALGSIWGPMASGFGSLLSGALPVVGAISGIIAVVSILGDKFGGLEGIFNRIFGDEGPEKLKKFQDIITGLFDGSLIANGMKSLGETIFGKFDMLTESYQGGWLSGMFSTETIEMFVSAINAATPILQSVMGVVEQIVTFANTTVKPIIEQIFGFITQTVVPVLLQTFTAAAPIISGIISNLGAAVMTCMQIIGTAIQAALPIIQNVISVVMSIASVVIPALLAGYETFSSGLAAIVSAVQTVFQGIIDFVTGVFTLNWQQAWQGVQDIFGGIFEGLEALIKTPLNAVIAVINKAISGINGLGLDIPDWVPIIGGQKFSINIPEIPMLAQGGFTTGPSIAGEAGTEAVISFQRSARASNIATWAKAGQMLGVSNQPARLETFDTGGNGTGGADWSNGNGGGPMTVTYAPTIIIQGNASKEDVDAALRDDKARFDAWYEEKRRNERRARW